MPRNRYTKLVRKEQRAQIARQEQELAATERRLRRQDAEPPEVPPINKEKERRSTRVERKRRQKTKRGGNANEDQR